MKILLLTRDLPYPADNGYRKRNYYLLKELQARGIDTILVTRKTSNVRQNAIDELKKYCGHIELIDAKEPERDQLWHLLKSLFSLEAFTLRRRYSKEIKRAVIQLSKENKINAVICDSVYQSLNMPFDPRIRTVLYEHNIESIILKRYAINESNIFKKMLAFIEYFKMSNFQKKIWKKFDYIIACSSLEKKHIEQRAKNTKVFVVNNGVDVEYFDVTSHKSPVTSKKGNSSLIYTGKIDWFPNRDAVLYLFSEIYPIIKKKVENVSLFVVGNNPSENIKNYAQHDTSIRVTGYVDDVRPFVERSAVYIVPLRIGSGTRLKILEALSMKKAVVSTSIGCEGLDVEDGKHLLIRDDPHEFAEAVVELLRNEELRKTLGEAGRRLVEEKYDWGVVFGALDDILREMGHHNTTRALDLRNTIHDARY